MNVRSMFDEKVEKWNLLNHPFYQAWNSGDLPESALRTYAEEYGAFIALMPIGWRGVGDEETALEEEEHIELWEQFAAGLGTQVSVANINEVKQLVENTLIMFGNSTTALGALYAFEVQQPETAKSKLSGLREFYELSATTETYFETHTANEHEAEKLMANISQLEENEQFEALDACEQMSRLLWDALTGIFVAEDKM